MQIYKIFKILIYCTFPLLIGASIGLISGGIVPGLHLIFDFGLSGRQQSIAFYGFLALGFLFGVGDTIKRMFRVYDYYEKRNKS